MPWGLKEADLKRYPHFDPIITASEGEALATDPQRVATHTFYPFMRYVQRWNRFAKVGQRGKPKERPIRYAARADAYIFSYYRSVLSEKYEAELTRLGLSDSVLAYRRIQNATGAGGKCNIHFARDAFLKIRELGNCTAIALDISSYFESLDHQHLKALWCRLLNTSRLPDDHFKVFEAITRYAFVEKEGVYERLGHYGVKRQTKSGRPIKGYVTPYREISKQLCTGAEFRSKIARSGSRKSLIHKNYRPYGIPQGAPISDLLANLYLIDFDTLVSGWARSRGGAYFRYSDDILIIVPGDAAVGCELEAKVRAAIGNFGAQLHIKEEKSSVFTFARDGDGGDQRCSLVKGSQGKNGIEYLGFRYDGRRIYLRNSTLSGLYRRVTRAARREAHGLASRYTNKNAHELGALFNYERFVASFGRVEGFDEQHGDYRNWTFWTYTIRAAEIFGELGRPICRQLRRHRTIIRQRVDKELQRAVLRRDAVH